MGFVFSRIDSRFVHGQVGAKIVKMKNVSRILIVDDAVAADDFLTTVFKIASVNAKVDVYSVESAIKNYEEGKFESANCMLLFGNITTAYRTYQGIKYPELDVGSIKCDRPNEQKLAADLVYMTKEEAEYLKEMKADGCNVYIQAVPDTAVIPLEKGLERAGF